MASKDMTLQVRIAGKVDSSLKTALNSVSSGLKSVTKVVAGVTTAAVGAVGAVAAASIEVGKEFESSMSSLAATAAIEQGSEAYQQLKDAAMAAGESTTKTATEAAEALNYMALAGWDVDTSISALMPVLRLSEATDLDLATTSDLVTDSMSAMGISIDSLSNYLDVCAAASTNSNQTAEMMMEAMIDAGGAARAAGLDYKETATVLGVLANNGVKGAEAGTALNSMLVRISTKAAAADAFEELGVAVYDDTGAMRNLQDILIDTNAAMDGMTESERNSYAAAIAGTNYYSDFMYLLNGVSDAVDENGSSWDQLLATLNDCDGALETMAETKTDNLEGDLSRLSSVASSLGIEIYDSMGGALREVTQLGTDMMTELKEAFDEGGFEGLVSSIGGVLAEAVSQIGVYIPQAISMGVSLVSSFVEGIGSASGEIAAVAASAVTEFVTGAFDLLPDVVLTGIDVILNFINGMIGNLPAIISSGASAISSFVSGLSERLPDIISTGIQLIISLITGLGEALPSLIESAGTLVTALIDAIANTNWLQVGIDLVTALGKGIINCVSSIGSTIWGAIKGIFTGGDGGNAEEELEAIGNDLSESYASGIEAGADAAAAAAESISAITADLDTSAMQVAGAETVDAYSMGITTNIPVITAAADDMASEAFADMDLDALEEAGLASVESYSEGITTNIPIVTAAADDMGLGITDSLSDGWKTAQNEADTAMAEITKSVTNEAQAAAAAIKNAFENMTITIPKPKMPVITTTYKTETYGEGGSVQIPEFNVAWNALGGIIDDPTLLASAQGLQGVGEAGPEAILPLDSLWTEMRDIFQGIISETSGESLIDKLLDKLSGIAGGAGNGDAVLAGAGAGGSNITYAPVYNLYGTATKDDAVQAEKISQAEFSKLMREYERQNARTKF